jgi:hypothetical protein
VPGGWGCANAHTRLRSPPSPGRKIFKDVRLTVTLTRGG